MAVEPQVFICYGRPDQDVAHQIAKAFWSHRIECYNYMLKPVEDRLGSEIDHRGYLYATRLFIAIVSEDSIPRFLVTEEIAVAHKIATELSDELCRVYISLLRETSALSLPSPDLIVRWHEADGPDSIVSDLLEKMGTPFLERNQKAWEINKSLYADQWEALNQRYK
jgi:hypothetical protein